LSIEPVFDWNMVETLIRAIAVQVDPETSRQDARLCMFASDLGCRMAVAYDSLVGIVTKHYSLSKANEAFACQTK
jgi:hypothetical protein